MKLTGWVALAALAVAPAAKATELSLTLLAGLNFHDPSISGLDTGSENDLAYGALVGVGTPWAFSVETGVMRLQKDYSVGNATTNNDAWEVPLLLRYNVRGIFSVGVGGYYQSVDQSLESATDDDYGLKGSARVGVPLMSNFKVVLEGQYNYGLKDLQPGTGSNKNRELLALGGLQFGF